MSKVINSFYIKTGWVLILLTGKFYGYAQDTTLNKYGLWVIKTRAAYEETIKRDAEKLMIDLKKTIPNLAMDLKYAGKSNFMKTKLYPSITTTYLRKPAAMALARAQKELNEVGFGLKILDAYRPYTVTEKMWELVKDDRYAANPSYGSGHNRGIAVDVTIVNLKSRRPLNMGTEFDNFTDTAHHNFSGLPKEVLQNRAWLRTLMEKNGFKPLETEWWHYSYSNAATYELLDLRFDELKTSKF